LPAGFPEPPAAPAPAGEPPVDPWLPLYTHADDDQRCRADAEELAEPDPAGSAHPPAAGAPKPPRSSRQRPRRRPAGTPASAGEAGTDPAAGHRAPPTPDRPDRRAPEGPSVDDDTGPARERVGLVDPREASSLAGAFAADYQSWDESAPRRRGEVLAQYLPSDVVGDASLLGWSGTGRQRAEFALPGAVHPDGADRVVVDVRVRVTPYRAVGIPADPAPAGDLEVAGVPAVAPAPTARGWKSLDSYWVRLTVPVTRDRGRLVVDTWDEQLGDEHAAGDEHPADRKDDRTDGAASEDRSG
jgi:hypothetical protein